MNNHPRRLRPPAVPVQGEPVSEARPRVPHDFDACHRQLGAMCGHGAFAAALGFPVTMACGFFPELRPDRGWVNLPEMETALRRAEERELIKAFHSTRDQWPEAHGAFTRGLVVLQWLGSWLDEGVPPAAACRHTHWIATFGGSDGLVYDVNIGQWITRARYESTLNCMLRQRLDPKSTGWRVKRGYEIIPRTANL